MFLMNSQKPSHLQRDEDGIYYSSLPIIIESDTSDFAQCRVISQQNPETSELQPIAFYSQKFNSVELNYKFSDKEILTIIDIIYHYHHYFEGLSQMMIIYSDYKKLL